MISMTARHSQLRLRSGASSSQELDAAGQLPSRPPSPEMPAGREANLEWLAQQARKLAHSHRLSARPGRDRLLGRLANNERVLQQVYQRLMRMKAARRTLPAAGVVAV